jgi:hypothetical protein
MDRPLNKLYLLSSCHPRDSVECFDGHDTAPGAEIGVSFFYNPKVMPLRATVSTWPRLSSRFPLLCHGFVPVLLSQVLRCTGKSSIQWTRSGTIDVYGSSYGHPQFAPQFPP